MNVNVIFEGHEKKMLYCPTDFRTFCIKLSFLFSNLPENYILESTDTSNGKLTTIRDQEDFDEFIDNRKSFAGVKRIIYIVRQENIPADLHPYTNCNGCQAPTIIGVRYKCTVCPDFNFCEECEKTKDHPHNFVKMKQCDEFDRFKYELTRKKLSVKPREWMKFDSNTDDLAQELFKVRNSSLENKVQYGKELNDNCVSEDDAKPAVDLNNIVKEEDDVDFGLIDQKIAALSAYFPESDIQDLYFFVSQAPKDLTIEELKENFQPKNRNPSNQWRLEANPSSQLKPEAINFQFENLHKLLESYAVNKDNDLAKLKKQV